MLYYIALYYIIKLECARPYVYFLKKNVRKNQEFTVFYIRGIKPEKA
jgi:hypothetical protein